MPRLLNGALLAVVSLAAGSWIGLGAPDAAQARVLGHRLVDGGLAALQDTPAPDTSGVAPHVERPRSPPPDEPSRSVDPSLLPDPRPWPRLNPEASVARAWLLAEGPARSRESGRRLVTFTFDDGPFPETTPGLLRLLARYDVRATFFFVGRYLDGDDERAQQSREAARQIVREGHLVGNHTHDHQLLTRLPPALAMAQIDDGATSIERTIGKRPVFFRPPYGKLDDWSKRLVRDRGLDLILWSIEAQDMKESDPEALFERLKQQIEYAEGGVVLLHDIRFSTGMAMEKLLQWLALHRFDPARPEKIGFEIVDLVTYLKETAAAPQPFADRKALEKARSYEWRKAHHARVKRILGDGED
jgi:peptidoglycan/xylan/chitin deacetylase (PgdA/CDA1 family)